MGIGSWIFGDEREKGGGEGGAARSQSQSPGPGANNNSRVANSKAANPNASKASAANTNTTNSKVANSKAAASPAAASPAAIPNGVKPPAAESMVMKTAKKKLQPHEWGEASGLTQMEKLKKQDEHERNERGEFVTCHLVILANPEDEAGLRQPITEAKAPAPGTPKSATGTSNMTTTPSKGADSTSQAQPETTTANPIVQQDASSMVTEVGDVKAKKGSKLNPKNWLWWYWLIIGILVLAVVAVIVVVCFFAFKQPSDSTSAPMDQSTPRNIPSRPTPSRPICTTSACTAYSTALTASINKAIKPCDDFHEYACEKHDYTKDKVSFIGSAEVGALMNDAQATSTGLPQIAKMLYDACEKGSLVDKKIKNAVSLVSDNVIGGNPNGTVKNLAAAGYTNFGHFRLDLERLTDPNEINPKMVLIIQNRANYATTEQFGYEDFDQRFVQSYDAFDSKENILTPSNNTLVPLSDITGMNAVKRILLKNVLEGWFPAGTTEEFMFANVWTYKYEYWTKALDASVDTSDAYTKKKMNNFHVFFAEKELERSLRSIVSTPKECSKLVASMIPQAFVNFHKIDKKKEDKIKGMAEEYKAKQVGMLTKLNVDDTTRTTFTDKVTNIRIVVGWPEKYATNLADGSSPMIDVSKMADIYEAYPQVKKLQVRQHFAYLAKPQEYAPAFLSVLPPSTIYNSDASTLYIHPRLLDDPSLYEDYPSYVVNGAVGVVIGKAFADIIIHHASTTANYKQSAQCYGEEGKERPYGKSTRDELVGDHLGVISSYKMAKKDEAAPLLPGFKSKNNDDVFFLAMAQRMCATPFDGFTIRNDADEFKKVGKKRVNTMVSNMPEFATTFNCKPAAQMHKTPKCTMY